MPPAAASTTVPLSVGTGGCSSTDALARLRGYAFVHRRLLLDVARDVVERRLVFTEETT